MKEPFLYQGSDPVDWSFGQLVRMVEDVRSIGCLETLVTEADRAGVTIPIPPEAINFVKKFLFQGGFHKIPDKPAAGRAPAAPQAATTPAALAVQPIADDALAIEPTAAAAPAARPIDATAAAAIARDVIASASCGGRPPGGGPPVFPPPGPGGTPPM
jgi:hypothetical protein